MTKDLGVHTVPTKISTKPTFLFDRKRVEIEKERFKLYEVYTWNQIVCKTLFIIGSDDLRGFHHPFVGVGFLYRKTRPQHPVTTLVLTDSNSISLSRGTSTTITNISEISSFVLKRTSQISWLEITQKARLHLYL